MFLTRNYKILFSCLMIVLSLVMMAPAVLAEETGAQKALGGLKTTGEEGYKVKDADLWQGGPSAIIGKIIGAALAFLGIAFFILMIYGGYMWMFSMGNEQTSAKAKEIIIAAVIGLAIVLMAYVITMFIAGIFPDVTGVKSE